MVCLKLLDIAESFLTVPKKQEQQKAANAEGGAKKKKVTAAQLRVQKGKPLRVVLSLR